MCLMQGWQTYGNGGLGSRSTLSRVRMSSLGSWQCCSGFSPGTLISSAKGATSMLLPKMLDLALAEAARKGGGQEGEAPHVCVTCSVERLVWYVYACVLFRVCEWRQR